MFNEFYEIYNKSDEEGVFNQFKVCKHGTQSGNLAQKRIKSRSGSCQRSVIQKNAKMKGNAFRRSTPINQL